MPQSPRKKADLAVAARWIVPVEPAGVVLENHALVITGDRLAALMPQQEVAQAFDVAETIVRPDHVLLPGLVNAHTHAAMTLLRGLADDLPLGQWLAEHIWPAENRWAGTEFVRDGTRLALLEMARGGITCFNDMYYFPDVVADLAVEHGMRAAVGMIVIEQPTPWAATVDEYFSKGLAVHDQYRDHPLIRVTFAPHAPYTVSDPTFSHLRLLADELDVPVHMHLHETRHEVEESVRLHGRRPLARLDALGLVASQLIGVHMTEVAPDEIALLAERNATVVHCPVSNQKLASGFCPVSRLLSGGVNVALGTDGAASNNRLDMLGEMRAAAVLAKAVAADSSALAAEQALAMATLNGARALGLDAEIGSLAPGKRADFICVDLKDPSTQPVHHVISQLVYAASSAQVTDTWVAGRRIVTDRRAVDMDENDIYERAEGWRARLATA